jgi:thiol-disulfide isomerase/thioredoxin
MKNLLLIIGFLSLPFSVFSQEFINDKNFDEKIKGNPFDDDNGKIVIVEFWADFNKNNAFKEWNQLKGVTYYRCDLATSPEHKAKYKIRMAPTILIFSEGEPYIKFKAKAGLDLLCPVDLPKMERAIEVVKREAQY